MSLTTQPPGAFADSINSATTAKSIEQLVLQKSIRLVVQQSRIGLVTVCLVVLALAAIYAPAVGWLPYSVWAVFAMGGFIGRQVWFEKVLRQPDSGTAKQLTLIAAISALTGWLVVLSLPVFGPSLPDQEVLFLSALMLAWVAAAVSVLGVKPRVYALYLVACLGAVWVSFWPRASLLEAFVMGSAMTLGGLMMYRLAVGIHTLMLESVTEGTRSQTLARKLDESLQAQQDAFATRSRFLAAASHDLKQPVHALAILVSVMRRTSDEQRRQQVVDEIGRAAHSIDTMFSSLLDMARIDAGSINAKNGPVDLVPLLHSVLAGYPQRCEEKGLNFGMETQLAPTVLSDPLLLQRILANLLDNALKYTSSGGVQLKVYVEAPGVCVEIEDTGVGMDAEESRHMFEAFMRGRSAHALGEPGLGLGLAIAQHMSALIDARLHIASQVGKGTRATISLPLAKERDHVLPPVEVLPALGGHHVILIEDDDQARTAMTYWLTEIGATVTALGDGQDLWRQLLNKPSPGWLLADFNLGADKDNGALLAQRLRQRYPGIRIILVTGEQEVKTNLPGSLVLGKPVQVKALSEAMLTLLEANSHD